MGATDSKMLAQIELQVYEELVAYLSGKKSLTDLRRTFDGLTWDTGEWNSDFLGQIELALAEFSSGHRGEGELKDVLQNTPNLTLQVNPLAKAAVACSMTGAVNDFRTITPFATAKLPDLSVGKLREKEYA